LVIPLRGVNTASVAESDQRRGTRERKRTLFGEVADQYHESRQSYPDEIVDCIVTTAELGDGASALEIGCGTGQLTWQLAGRGLEVTAIDLAPSMIAVAEKQVPDSSVSFAVAAFEDFGETGPYDLIVSATAFHWIDPAVAWTKASRLLQPEGWLALLTTGERYPEPLRSSLHDLWLRCTREDNDWAPGVQWAETFRDNELFGAVAETTHERSFSLSADGVLAVERTRATFLSFDAARRREFSAGLARLLDASPVLDVTQETYLAMARVVPIA
jgi:2-polyprenyl-3-methyl-5-hydroxy-6-metoxy-1,4-benzoquinol methylase